MKLLIWIKSDRNDDHGVWAWLVASHFIEVTDCEVIAADANWHNAAWSPDEVWGGLVFNADGDAETIAKLRQNGKPCLYYPTIGSVCNGMLHEGVLHEMAHRTGTRLKMQEASAVLCDSFVQARAARDHYDLTTAYIAIPPPVDMVDTGEDVWTVKRMLVTERPPPIIVERLPAHVVMSEDRILCELAQGARDCGVVWAAAPWYGYKLMQIAAYGVPLAALDMGLVDAHSAIASWCSEDRPLNLAPLMDVAQGACRARSREAQRFTWSVWCQSVLSNLRRLKVSPVQRFIAR